MNSVLERPTVFDAATRERIVSLLALGSFAATACRAAGVSYQGYRRWQRMWEEGDPKAERFAGFFEAAARASAMAEVEALSKVRSGRPGWRSSAWFLGRRFPGRWGRKARLIPRGVDVKRLTDEKLRAMSESSRLER
jgi:hypothetical protein